MKNTIKMESQNVWKHELFHNIIRYRVNPNPTVENSHTESVKALWLINLDLTIFPVSTRTACLGRLNTFL